MASFTSTWNAIPDAAPGSVVTMTTQVTAADSASCGLYNINMMVQRLSDNVIVSEQNFFNQPVSQTPQQFQRTWATPSTVGQYKAIVNVWNNSGVNVWAALTSVFNVASAQTHMALYGTYSPFPVLLKPASSTDALSGGGFLPNTADNWALVPSMSDDFTGPAIDTTKWSLRLPGGWDHYNDELERYVDSGVIVSNGTCKLTGVARPGTSGHAASPSGFQYNLYDSGCITTKATVIDGFFEARVKLPAGQGVWPAFWALPTANYQGEVDMMEYVFNAGTEWQSMIHNSNLCDSGGNQVFWCDKNYNSQWGFWKAPSNLSQTYMVDDWHVISCLKQNGTTTVYIDGYPVCQRKISPANLPMQVILNLAMGGGWPTTNGNGQAWTQPVSLGPEVFEIDYVRVYQKN